MEPKWNACRQTGLLFIFIFVTIATYVTEIR